MKETNYDLDDTLDDDFLEDDLDDCDSPEVAATPRTEKEILKNKRERRDDLLEAKQLRAELSDYEMNDD